MPEFVHIPVLLAEVLQALQPKPGGWYVDGTIGGGGHATALLRASAPTGRLFGCDRDGAAIDAATAQLAEFAGRFELRRGGLDELPGWLPSAAHDGVLFDLGVSSAQLDVAQRGFSFQQDGPLDMRMDDRQSLTAAVVVNESPAAELERIFREFGEERQARRLANAIVETRRNQPLAGTRQLAELIERVAPRHGRVHPATRVFQALRICVNDELGALERGLAGALQLLRPGGRLAVITFHSLEDRKVKAFGREVTRDYTFEGEVDVPELRQPQRPQMRWVSRKAVQPTPAEVAANPRARSAQLRVLERI